MRAMQHQPRTTTDVAASARAPFAVDVVSGRREATVSVVGELDASSAPRLVAALDEVERGAGSGQVVLLDLSGTTFIDSAGIRVLVRSLLTLRDAGSPLRLVAASAIAENILRITGILDVLKEPAP